MILRTFCAALTQAMTAGTLAVIGASLAAAAPTPAADVIVGGIGESTLMQSSLTEQFVSPQNPSLFGFGRVTDINGLSGTSFCVQGPCELTYTFSNYVPIAFNTSGPENSVVFTGGWVDFYLDSTPNSSLETATGFDDGAPWLSLIGFETTATSGPNAGLTGTLFSTATNVLDPENIRGSGIGFLEVVGGPAAAHFGLGNVMTFDSSFQPSPDGWALPLADPANLEIVALGTATDVPEPAILGILGLGLLAIASLATGKAKTKTAAACTGSLRARSR